MGVDIVEMKKRQQEEEARKSSKGGKSGWRFWTPKPGQNRIRLMPPWKESEPSFFREIAMHFNVGPDDDSQQSFACPDETPKAPAEIKGHCTVCPFVKKLRATGDPTDAEYANNIRAKKRYYSNIVDLEDAVYTSKDVSEWAAKQQGRDCPFQVGDSKIQIYAYPPTVWKDFMDVFCQQNKDLTDFTQGHDVWITREGVDRQTKYRVRFDFQPTNYALVGRPLAEVLIDLDGIAQFLSPEQMRAVLEGAPATAPAAQLPHSANGTNGTAHTAPSLPPATAPAPVAVPQPAKLAVAAAPPPCYQDKATCAPDDQECVGGKKGADEYDPCEFFQPCYEAKFGQPVQAKTSRRAARPAAAPAKAIPNSVEELEAQMKKILS